MLLTRKSDARPHAAQPARAVAGAPARASRRWTAARSSSARASRPGAAAFASQLPYGTMRQGRRPPTTREDGKREVHRTVCTHCSVGCAIDAVVENGVWVRQEPVFDSPLNLGAHCAKGASIREHGHGEHSHA